MVCYIVYTGDIGDQFLSFSRENGMCVNCACMFTITSFLYNFEFSGEMATFSYCFCQFILYITFCSEKIISSQQFFSLLTDNKVGPRVTSV